MSGSPPTRTRAMVKAGGAVGAAALIAIPILMALEGDGNRIGYRDIVGVATSCYGHTGADVVVGRRYTREECRGQLATDVAKHAEGIRACIKVDVPVESFAAFTSFAFNVGVRGFCGSKVARMLNAGDLAGACAGMDAWVYAGGRRVQGLVNRRRQERALCERGLS